ncbi:MAG: prepilin-type N-terminal cleavage/methylation domain-containing protein [Gammaproteobacteria bacterium]|nr:MAG: prepilin-type N-terminal cleavage/methylation domain-containing protein [Gammaproteobacteria bacterium]
MKDHYGGGRKRDMKRDKGFTLIELLVTLAVATILVFVAVPSFGGFIRNSQMTTQANALFFSLQYAKSEAANRNIRVTICASSDGASCSSSPNWHTGWIIFTDDTGVSGVYDGDDRMLKKQRELTGQSTLISDGVGDVQFISRGWRHDYQSAGASDITFTLDHPECTGKQKKSITVSIMGSIASDKEDC